MSPSCIRAWRHTAPSTSSTPRSASRCCSRACRRSSPSGCAACRTICSTSAPTCRSRRPPAARAGAHGAGAAQDRRERGSPRAGDCACDYTLWLEHACDEVNATLEPLRSFVIPGGSPAAAQLHVCRTVCRRAERRTIAVGAEVNPEVVRYLNRLSDLLFILSRAANLRVDDGKDARSEPLWDPGAHGSGAGQQPPESATDAAAWRGGQRRSAARRAATASAVQSRPRDSRRGRRWAYARRGSAASSRRLR